MPIYEYVCSKCGKFEKMQKFSDEPLTKCPNCFSDVYRLIGRNVGVQFKGSGFYKNDSLGKDKLRKLNQERQKDNECLLDGDVSSYAAQTEETNSKIMES
ncbi:MAG: transcriptional regulator [Syntrophomonadaceae bacterium]|jgi:putative FmdB family regulatory protein|nr:transcriptional regulator [Syntrophomonadaceae bacterium]